MTIEEIKAKWGNDDGCIDCSICPVNAEGVSCSKYHMDEMCNGYGATYKAIQRYFAEQEAAEQPSETAPSTRRDILVAAINCVCTDRDAQYGSPEDSFAEIARLWSDYTGYEITPHDAAVMMALLKVARIKTGRYKDDSYIDAAGYIACAAEIGRANDE